MAQPQSLTITVPDPAHMARLITDIAGKTQRLLDQFVQRQVSDGTLDWDMSLSLTKDFMMATQRMMADPAKLAQAQWSLWQDSVTLWQRGMLSFWGQKQEPLVEPAQDDRRFKHDDWQDYFWFDYIKQSYLLTTRWLQRLVADIDGLDEHTHKKIDFYTRQFMDTLAPTNFPMTNPEVLRATVESGGENLLHGFSNLLDDLERGKGKLKIRMTDSNAFDLGANIAVTPGKIIYQNELMQLIQYQPSTETVYKTPLLIVPPWINKFYVMDLRPKNSLIKWLVDQGLTVFVISWINPGRELADKNFEDYLLLGPLQALEAIEKATGERQVNGVGYCLGGTLLAIATAYLAGKRKQRFKACTFLTTLLDFAEPGELEIFIDEEQLQSLEKRMERRGFLDGSEMAMTFSLLRANDLIWAFFINNYLLGKEPFPFDLLYWNADSTRMPATMHSYYLRNMYQKNALPQPGGIELAGQPIDLRKSKVAAYFLAAVEDHIAPWKSIYMGCHQLSGPRRFVLSSSGHIAGVINPPATSKYCYWLNAENPPTWKEWFANAERLEGSWWPDWGNWLGQYGGDRIPARIPGDGQLAVIEDAPGSYVRIRNTAAA
ncbi:MAG: class I poly(R)-hydroxyalkanoic acid synthase [Gammaproteobacteria bacterium]|nr:class I poly(R)-hydroxyalkanoic acid synthase [Gammaproteobacteria bacterium]MCP5425479.1 class I poly(R)-hydroxyalkanoic acid synthase [Gammaproteobacteria bacterium]MCP5459918.1 class I poly(R)-hydroxyalkanoic acid synthase [Gammaproteobacteria bacterium]